MSKGALFTIFTLRPSVSYLTAGILVIASLFALNPSLIDDAEILAHRLVQEVSAPANECDFVKLWSEQNEEKMIASALGKQDFETLSKKKANIGFLPSGEAYSIKNNDGDCIRVSGLLLDLSKRDVPFYRLNINVTVKEDSGKFEISKVNLAPTCNQNKLTTLLTQVGDHYSEIRNKNFQSLNTLKRTLVLESIHKDENAKIVLEEIVKSNPQFWPAIVRYGYLKHSYEILSLALKIRPDYSRAYSYRSIVSGQFGQPESIADYQKAIELEPDYVRAWCEIAQLRDDPKRSVKDLEIAVNLNSNDVIAVAERSGYNERAGNLKEALQDLDSLVALKPTWYEAYFRRGKLKSKMGDNKGALRDLNSAIEKFKGDGGDYYLIQMLYTRGCVYRELGKIEEAIADFDRISTLDNRKDGSLTKAEMLFDAGKEKEAKRAWMEKSEIGYSDYGLVGVPASFFDQENVSKRNRDRYAEAVKKRLKSAEGYHKRALARQSGGDIKGAMSDINEAIKLEPHNSALYETRFDILPNSKGALNDLEIAIKLDPQNPLLIHKRAGFRRYQHDRKGSLEDERLAKILCKKKYSMKEIRENPFLHDLYYGFPAPSQEYDHTSAFMYPAMKSQHFEQF